MSLALVPDPADIPTSPTADGFAALGVPPLLVADLRRRGITAPSPIQASTIPDALAGRDVCGHAPTGSGKTIAFGIPLVLGVERARPHQPRGLVLVPTRELAAQVAAELTQLADGLAGRPSPDRTSGARGRGPGRTQGKGARRQAARAGAKSVAAFYGGVGFGPQCAALRRGVDIVVACPGRLADLAQQGEVDLSEVDFVVIDEADRMADMGFLPETRRLLDACADDRQTLLFSATLDDDGPAGRAAQRAGGKQAKSARARAGDVGLLIRTYQTDPVRHSHTPPPEAPSRAVHLFWAADRAERTALAARVIERLGSTVVFCRTKRGADRVARQLGTNGVTAAAIHGDRSQGQRERALAAFHAGQVQALVATDVAARGIHVDDVACVIHFDPPAEAEDYVHRSGRTARAGAAGVVVTLVVNEVRPAVKALQKALDLPVGVDKADLAALDAAARPGADDHRRERAAGGSSNGSPDRRDRPRDGGPNGSAGDRRYGPRRSDEGNRRPPRRAHDGRRADQAGDGGPAGATKSADRRRNDRNVDDNRWTVRSGEDGRAPGPRSERPRKGGGPARGRGRARAGQPRTGEGREGQPRTGGSTRGDGRARSGEGSGRPSRPGGPSTAGATSTHRKGPRAGAGAGGRSRSGSPSGPGGRSRTAAGGRPGQPGRGGPKRSR